MSLALSGAALAQDISVAVVGPMTGSEASFGQQFKNGAELAVAEINARGGLLGQKLKLEIGDDACDPKQAVSVAEKMAGMKVPFVAGAEAAGRDFALCVLHMIACGHVAVLTELITRGRIGDGNEGQFAYGRRIVMARFGEVAALFGISMLVRGVRRAFHNALDTLGEWLPTPGVSTIVGLVNTILSAATRYLDKVVLSYDLARGGDDPRRNVQDGLVYYCQNAKPILTTSIWIVVVERSLSILLCLLLLVPAGFLTMVLPDPIPDYGAVVTILVAALLAATLRSAFIQPLFLICIMIRFHALVQEQPINATWVGYLDGLTDKFRQIGR
jgi:hypothetical protein